MWVQTGHSTTGSLALTSEDSLLALGLNSLETASVISEAANQQAVSTKYRKQ